MPFVAKGSKFAPDVVEARIIISFDDVARIQWTTIGGQVITSVESYDIAVLARAILDGCAGATPATTPSPNP